MAWQPNETSGGGLKYNLACTLYSLSCCLRGVGFVGQDEEALDGGTVCTMLALDAYSFILW